MHREARTVLLRWHERPRSQLRRRLACYNSVIKGRAVRSAAACGTGRPGAVHGSDGGQEETRCSNFSTSASSTARCSTLSTPFPSWPPSFWFCAPGFGRGRGGGEWLAQGRRGRCRRRPGRSRRPVRLRSGAERLRSAARRGHPHLGDRRVCGRWSGCREPVAVPLVAEGGRRAGLPGVRGDGGTRRQRRVRAQPDVGSLVGRQPN